MAQEKRIWIDTDPDLNKQSESAIAEYRKAFPYRDPKNPINKDVPDNPLTEKSNG